MTNTAYIGVASNMGDSLGTIQTVTQKLDTYAGVTVTATSKLYITDPVGNVDQAQFINAVLKVQTDLTPMQLLDVLHDLEQQFHRVRTIHWGPRTLDLDIELFNDLSIQTTDLTVPHAEMFNRLFVLIPLLDVIDPTHPQYAHIKKSADALAGSQFIQPIN